jgi:cytochrome b6-f complex iron-sulfur subunit
MVKPDKQPAASRRNFLSKIWIGLGIAALLQFLTGSVLYFFSGRKKIEPEKQPLLDAGVVADFQPGSITYIARGHLYLSRLDDGGFLAISKKCTHLGCAVPWIAERKQFECPCHASVFDQTGNVIKSPAPRALDLYTITIKRDRIMIDPGSLLKRSSFSVEQVTYPRERG